MLKNKMVDLSTSHHELNAIEIEQSSDDTGTAPFIDSTTYTNLIITFLFYLIFQATYIFTGLNSPRMINKTEVFYPLTQEFSNNVANLRLMIKPIVPENRFLHIEACFARFSVAKKEEPLIKYNMTLKQISNNKVINEESTEQKSLSVKFFVAKEESNTIVLIDKPTKDFDTYNISVDFYSDDFHNIKGFKFLYTFADPNLSGYLTKARLLLSFCSLFGFICFMICIKVGMISTFQTYSLILGILATLSTNPFSALFNIPIISKLDSIYMIVFLSFFRFYILSFLDSVLYLKEQNSNKRKISYIVFLCLYGLVELYSTAQFNIEIMNNNSEISIYPTLVEHILLVFHLTYAIVTLFMFIFAVKETFDVIRFKTIAYGLFIVATGVITVYYEAISFHDRAIRGTAAQLLIYHSSYILASIVFLFYQHTTSNGYESLEENIKDISLKLDYSSEEILGEK